MAYGFYLQATYASGYVLVEDAADRNPFGDGNTFTAIRTHAATEAGHGDLTSLALVNAATWESHTIDWSTLAGLTDLRPIYYRKMKRTRNMVTGEDSGPMCNSHHFGYQYNDSAGSNVQIITEHRLGEPS